MWPFQEIIKWINIKTDVSMGQNEGEKEREVEGTNY